MQNSSGFKWPDILLPYLTKLSYLIMPKIHQTRLRVQFPRRRGVRKLLTCCGLARGKLLGNGCNGLRRSEEQIAYLYLMSTIMMMQMMMAIITSPAIITTTTTITRSVVSIQCNRQIITIKYSTRAVLSQGEPRDAIITVTTTITSNVVSIHIATNNY